VASESSTTVMTTKGKLYTVGSIHDLEHRFLDDSPPHEDGRFHQLQFPSSFGTDTHPSTSIRQFSAGVDHIVGVSWSGRIWSWASTKLAAINIKFLHADIIEATPSPPAGTNGYVRRVVSGMRYSSAYIVGHGIICWNAAFAHDEQDAEGKYDTALITESYIVPSSDFVRTGNERLRCNISDTDVGEVIDHVIVADWVVFITDKGKVFGSLIQGADETSPQQHTVFEMRTLRCDLRATKQAPILQGAYHKFAVVFNNKTTIVSHEYIQGCWNHRHEPDFDQSSISEILRIPALQHSEVVQIAFGRTHYHALHRDGYVTSWGSEPHSQGALGLGTGFDVPYTAMARLRGLATKGPDKDLYVTRYAAMRGRRIWFDDSRAKWLMWLTFGGINPRAGTNSRLLYMEYDPVTRGEVSEWIEQEGLDWDKVVPEDNRYEQISLT
jgi:SCF-associated factor 1